MSATTVNRSEADIVPMAQHLAQVKPLTAPRELTEADFPFQPELEHRMHELRDLEKLRAMRDRTLAKLALEAYQARQVPSVESKQIWLPKAKPTTEQPVTDEDWL